MMAPSEEGEGDLTRSIGTIRIEQSPPRNAASWQSELTYGQIQLPCAPGESGDEAGRERARVGPARTEGEEPRAKALPLTRRQPTRSRNRAQSTDRTPSGSFELHHGTMLAAGLHVLRSRVRRRGRRPAMRHGRLGRGELINRHA